MVEKTLEGNELQSERSTENDTDKDSRETGYMQCIYRIETCTCLTSKWYMKKKSIIFMSTEDFKVQTFVQFNLMYSRYESNDRKKVYRLSAPREKKASSIGGEGQ